MNTEEKRGAYQMRASMTDFSLRQDGEDQHPTIEGYFSVFNSDYNMGPDMSESIAPGAFTNTLGGDIRALIDHETRLVLGRTGAHTLELREDSHGLWGKIDINPKDVDAMNLVARLERGDVNQCSFGFDIIKEDTEFREDGSIHWTIREVKLYEVSVVTFPAYEDTSVALRAQQREQILARKAEAWRASMTSRLKGGQANVEGTDAQKED